MLLYPYAVYADVSSAASEVPSLDALAAAVQRLIAALYTLNGEEGSAAAVKLRMLAGFAEAMAKRRDH
jgi:hypothetical protein